MSMPSDVSPDIPPPSGPEPQSPRLPRARNQMTQQEQGWIVAALVAFLGIAYFGPAIARYRRRPPLKQRMARRLKEAESRARRVGRKARKRVRRLGGGTIWR